jgi:polysaccharide export outer membrane protein
MSDVKTRSTCPERLQPFVNGGRITARREGGVQPLCNFARLALFGFFIASRAVAGAQAPVVIPESALARDVDQLPPPDGVPDAEWTRWSGGRYRITPGDVLELTFPFVPELNQTVTVQPDGYIALKDIEDIRVQGRTVAQAKAAMLAAYEVFVRDPVLTVVLKEFEKPYFVANGEVKNPGRYELRGPTTLTQALAFAGGPTKGANTSQVVLFRPYTSSSVEVKQINIRRMYAKKNLSEDPLLRPGDMILVPKGLLGKLAPILETPIWMFLR